jgi:hypothetical protein
MSTSPVAGLFSLLNRFFPHRQFYLRSRGSVTFVEFSPTFQVTVAFALFSLLCWLVYASIVVIFKEQIISVKDQRYASMQDVYEAKLSQQQLAYDELNGLLVLAEERFQNATRDLESKHRQLTALLMQKQAMDKRQIGLRRQVADMGRYGGPVFARARGPSETSNTIQMQSASIAPAPRQGRPQRTISDGALGTVAASVGPRGGASSAKAALAQNHVVQKIAALEDRLELIKKSQVALLSDLREGAARRMERFEGILKTAEMPVDTVIAQVGGGAAKRKLGVGGPFLAAGLGAEVRAAAGDGIDDFEREFADVAEIYSRLDSLTTAMTRLPLVTPIEHGQYRSTSGYGYRVDPFTGRLAFHAGADMAGEFNTPIMATLPGRVVFSGLRGPYGLCIDIEHGGGVRTRYAHLKTSLVKPGDVVQFKQKIGTMGSSGRSTGPHLHYEIWFNDVVRNPMKFFDAGRNVYKG